MNHFYPHFIEKQRLRWKSVTQIFDILIILKILSQFQITRVLGIELGNV